MEAQEGPHRLLTPGPVPLTSQVQGAVVPKDRVRHAKRQAGVQVRFVLAQTCLRRQKPEREHGNIRVLTT